jgi:uncharacterized membrane protein YbhN (UPF0104 family)
VKAPRDEHTQERSSVRKIIKTLRILGAPLLLIIILLRVDLRETATAFAGIRLLPFYAAAALVPLNFAVLIFKWRYLLSGTAQVTRAQLIRSVIGGYAFVLATPGQVGEFSRALFIPGESKLRIMGLVAVDKFTAFVITVLLGLFSIGLWRAGFWYLPCFVFVAFLMWLVSQPRRLVALVLKLARRLPLRQKVFHFLEGFRNLSRCRWTILLLISLLHFFVFSLQFYLLLWAFEAVPLRTMVICFPLLMLINSIPITMGGLGIREGAAVLFFSSFGVQESSALGAALLLFAINILIPGLCGLAFIHHIGAKPKPPPEKNP